MKILLSSDNLSVGYGRKITACGLTFAQVSQRY